MPVKFVFDENQETKYTGKNWKSFFKNQYPKDCQYQPKCYLKLPGCKEWYKNGDIFFSKMSPDWEISMKVQKDEGYS